MIVMGSRFGKDKLLAN